MPFSAHTPEEFDPNIRRIGKDFLLISASDGARTNTMTASWGGVGYFWNRPVALCMIRPQRYTYELVEKSNTLSLSFFEPAEQYRSALSYCGRTSGRGRDKFAEAGLTPASTDGIPYPAEADTVLLCRKLYADDFRKSGFLDPALLENYHADDFHKLYVCEILNVLKAQR